MKLTYITEYNQTSPYVFSGTPYFISQTMRHENIELQPWNIPFPYKILPPLSELSYQCKRLWGRLRNKNVCAGYLVRRAKHIATMLKQPLENIRSDILLTAMTPISAAFLETKIPIVYWSDSVYGADLGFYYSDYAASHHLDTIIDAQEITYHCLHNAKLLLFSSQWIANNAKYFYGVPDKKIKVVPMGANIQVSHQLMDVKEIIRGRSKKSIKLLFVSNEWLRHGGDVVLKIAKALDEAKYNVQVTIVGDNLGQKKLPSYVRCISSFIRDSEILRQLYQESHFLLMPARNETLGTMFCEANAFGVPCIATQVGGIPEIIKNGINGVTFSLDTSVQQYCDYIINLIQNGSQYEALALSSYNEYETRLNWKTSIQNAKKLMMEI